MTTSKDTHDGDVTMPSPSPEIITRSQSDNSGSDTPGNLNNGKSSNNNQASKSNGVSKSPYKRRGQQVQSPPPPNSTIVMKNLDFNLESVELEEVLRGLSGGRLGYKNFYLQKDAQGKFRGMAFVNFHSVEEAQNAMNELRPLVLNGRKVYVEYRRLSRTEVARKEYEAKRGHVNNYSKRFEPPPRSTFEKRIDDSGPILDENGKELDKRAAFFKRYTEERGEAKFSTNGKFGRNVNLRTPENVEFEKKYKELLAAYRDAENVEGEEIPDFQFEGHLDSDKRFLVHQLCDQLGLAHISRYIEDSSNDEEMKDGEKKEEEKKDETKSTSNKGRRMIIVTRDPAKRAAFKQESVQQRKAAKEAAIKKRKEMLEKKKTVKVPLTEEEQKRFKWFRPRAQQNAEGGEQPVNEIKKPSFKTYVPPRQPKGPDGTIGFHSRKASSSDEEPTTNGVESKEKIEVETEKTQRDSKEHSSPDTALENGTSASSKRQKVKKLNPLVAPFVPSSSGS